MPALLLPLVLCGIQKMWFNILWEVCQEIAAYKKAAAASVRYEMTVFWIMHSASDKVLFMTSAILFSQCVLDALGPPPEQLSTIHADIRV